MCANHYAIVVPRIAWFVTPVSTTVGLAHRANCNVIGGRSVGLFGNSLAPWTQACWIKVA